MFHCIMHQRPAYFFSALSLQLLFSPFCLSRDIHARYDGTTIRDCGYHLVLLLHMECYRYHVNREELIATSPSCADDCVPSTTMCYLQQHSSLNGPICLSRIDVIMLPLVTLGSLK
jgi:hypothetical protein